MKVKRFHLIKCFFINRKIQKILKVYPEINFLIGYDYIKITEKGTTIHLNHDFTEVGKYPNNTKEKWMLLYKVYQVIGYNCY